LTFRTDLAHGNQTLADEVHAFAAIAFQENSFARSPSLADGHLVKPIYVIRVQAPPDFGIQNRIVNTFLCFAFAGIPWSLLHLLAPACQLWLRFSAMLAMCHGTMEQLNKEAYKWKYGYIQAEGINDN